MTVVILGGVLGWLVIDTAGNRIRLVSLGGLFCYIFLGMLISANPAKVSGEHARDEYVQMYSYY